MYCKTITSGLTCVVNLASRLDELGHAHAEDIDLDAVVSEKVLIESNPVKHTGALFFAALAAMIIDVLMSERYEMWFV